MNEQNCRFLYLM